MQVVFLDVKIKMSQMENSLDGIKGIPEEKINGLQDTTRENNPNKTQIEKIFKKWLRHQWVGREIQMT